MTGFKISLLVSIRDFIGTWIDSGNKDQDFGAFFIGYWTLEIVRKLIDIGFCLGFIEY